MPRGLDDGKVSNHRSGIMWRREYGLKIALGIEQKYRCRMVDQVGALQLCGNRLTWLDAQHLAVVVIDPLEKNPHLLRKSVDA